MTSIQPKTTSRMAEARGANDAVMDDKRQSPEREDHHHPEGAPENAAFKVFVGGISRDTDENEIFNIFRKYNPKEVLIMREMATQRPRGFGFITFSSQKDMDYAIEDMHNTRINGRVVTVSKARPFERPRGDRSPRRQGSPDRRAYGKKEGGEWAKDFPRRYHNHHDNEGGGGGGGGGAGGGPRQYHDPRRRSYETPQQNRRYQNDNRRPDDSYQHNQYQPNHYENRNERGDFGGEFEGRRGGYRGNTAGGRNEEFHRGGDGNRQGQWMDYDRRQQMRDREEGHRRWNPPDRERRPYNNNNSNANNNNYHGGREMPSRWRTPDGDDRRRDGPPRLDNRDEGHAARGGGGGQYGPVRRRGEVRRNEPYRHRSRSPPDRRGR